MCVCHCLLLVLCFHTWSVSHLRSSRLRWWRRSHVVHWHRPSGTSLPRLLSHLNCHVPSYKSPGKFIVLKMKTKKVTHTKKKHSDVHPSHLMSTGLCLKIVRIQTLLPQVKALWSPTVHPYIYRSSWTCHLLWKDPWLESPVTYSIFKARGSEGAIAITMCCKVMMDFFSITKTRCQLCVKW